MLGDSQSGRPDWPKPLTVDIHLDGLMAMGAGVVGGVAGMAIFRNHPVLAFVDGYELAAAATDLGSGAIGSHEAMKRVARAAVATVASLFLPVLEPLGWLAGAVTAHALIKDGNETYVENP